MECQASDSKKLFKVFDAAKRKRSRKKREGGESRSAVRSAASDGSTLSQGYQSQVRVASAKASLQEVIPSKTEAFPNRNERDLDSSPSRSRSPSVHKASPSPRRHRRPARDSMSLALKGGIMSTPRSATPPPEGEGTFETVAQDQGSFIYAFLEEAIKKDKKKQRHARRHEERDRERPSRARASTPCDKDHREHRDQREHRDHRDHRHHRRHDDEPREPEKPAKVQTPAPPEIDQTVLIQTFAKLCATLNTKTENFAVKNVPRSLSHKSLQCENVSNQTCCNDVDYRPVKLRSHETSHDNIPASRIRSHDDNRVSSRDEVAVSRSHLTQIRSRNTHYGPYDKENSPRERNSSKLYVVGSKMHNVTDDRCCEYAPKSAPTRTFLDESYRRTPNEPRGYREHIPTRDPPRDCDPRREPNREYDHDRELNRQYVRARDPDREKYYEDEKSRFFEQKTSRSFDVQRNPCVVDDRPRRSTRSEAHRDRRYEERRYDDRDRERLYEEMERRDKYYEDKPLVSRDRNYLTRESRERRSKKNLERFERASIASRDEEYKEKDRYSERERDSGLSVADGESNVSVRSNYLKLVKQEIMEQREAMDKMMNLWKELMRCFKSISHTSGSEKAVTESAANNARDSAAAQLRLWRECMRRYETVARDVGDTDARLMEEINKQRSEMAEMASMWQECLQRYREMSSDFNNLKQKLAAPTSPVRVLPQTVCAEGEGLPPATAFHPPAYPPMATYAGVGSPVRARASAPPTWWWGEAPPPPRAPTGRRSSPESRGSRDRDHERERRRHKDREREDSRYKEKSKPSVAHSEHRRRKR